MFYMVRFRVMSGSCAAGKKKEKKKKLWSLLFMPVVLF